MSFIEFFAPLRRQKIKFISYFIGSCIILWGLASFIPKIETTTVYFSLKPIAAENGVNGMYLVGDSAEEGSKIAETVAGWAQNPAFREKILKKANVYIPYFKRKLTARKQNRLNVFWTINLIGNETKDADKITESLISTFNENFEDFNKNSIFPYAISEPTISKEATTFPLSWKIIGIFFISLCFAFFVLYVSEAIRGKISFSKKVEEKFPETPILKISEILGKHNQKLVEQFIFTFESPRLVPTFKNAEKYFSIAPLDAIDEEVDTPILLIQLGKTNMRDLENLYAIFGNDIGIIIFEK